MHMHNNILLLITLTTIRLSVHCAGIYLCRGVKLYVCRLYVCVEDVFYLLNVHCAGIYLCGHAQSIFVHTICLCWRCIINFY
jgi:hypothetical protein